MEILEGGGKVTPGVNGVQDISAGQNPGHDGMDAELFD